MDKIIGCMPLYGYNCRVMTNNYSSNYIFVSKEGLVKLIVSYSNKRIKRKIKINIRHFWKITIALSLKNSIAP